MTKDSPFSSSASTSSSPSSATSTAAPKSTPADPTAADSAPTPDEATEPLAIDGPTHQGNKYPPSKAALEADADAAEARVADLRAQADVEEEAAKVARDLADKAK